MVVVVTVAVVVVLVVLAADELVSFVAGGEGEALVFETAMLRAVLIFQIIQSTQ